MGMYQVRLHGRGGQGVVTAAELLALAAFDGGHEAQALPSFGPERTGAPVVSYCRIDHGRPIRTHEPITAPDAVLVFDATLLHHVDVLAGLRPGGLVLLNSSRPPGELGLPADVAAHTLPANELAGATTGRPLGNTCLLGAFAALTGVITLDALERALAGRFRPAVAEGNVAAARAGFAQVGGGVRA
jgi:pyruvate ferredoxin oxidoreductase gamma subunit